MPLRETILAWEPMLKCGLLPIGQWGDGWGPLLLDVHEESVAWGRVGWIDHEAWFAMDERSDPDCAKVRELFQPLYAGFDALLEDLVG